jgi:hypothetical protein
MLPTTDCCWGPPEGVIVGSQALSFLLLVLAISAISALAQPPEPVPLTCTQVIAWSAGGVPSQRMARLVHQRGLAFPLDATTSSLLLQAGVEPALLQSLQSIAPAGRNVDRSGVACPCQCTDSAEEVSPSPIHFAAIDRRRSQQREPSLRHGLCSPAARRLGRCL